VESPFGGVVGVAIQRPGGAMRKRAGAVRINGLVGCMRQGSGQNGGVHIVHTFAFGPGHTGTGLAWIGDVFGSSQRLQGLECSSSPTSGPVFPLFRGLLASESAQTVHLWAPLGAFF
jgi:hypothetical protein